MNISWEHEMSGRLIDQMMAALAKKNIKQREQDQHRDPVTGEIKSKPRQSTGPLNKPHKRSAGRGR